MKRFLFIAKFSISLSLLLSLISCTAPNAKFSLRSAHYLNPDLNGRASPVVVTIYQLKKARRFMRASYEQLNTNSSAILGSTLIDKHTVILQPRHRQQLKILIDKNTRYFGFLAAYRELAESKWHQVIKLPLNKRSVAIEVAVQTQRLDAKLKNY